MNKARGDWRGDSNNNKWKDSKTSNKTEISRLGVEYLRAAIV